MLRADMLSLEISIPRRELPNSSEESDQFFGGNEKFFGRINWNFGRVR
jgi:hypothetical protein